MAATLSSWQGPLSSWPVRMQVSPQCWLGAQRGLACLWCGLALLVYGLSWVYGVAWPGDVVAWLGLDMSGLAWVWRGLAWL